MDDASSDLGSPVQPCPGERPPHWIEIELVGEDGKPIPWEEYAITKPDGEVVTGVLGPDGTAHVDFEQPGNCVVTFPRLDRDAWGPAP